MEEMRFAVVWVKEVGYTRCARGFLLIIVDGPSLLFLLSIVTTWDPDICQPFNSFRRRVV